MLHHGLECARGCRKMWIIKTCLYILCDMHTELYLYRHTHTHIFCRYVYVYIYTFFFSFRVPNPPPHGMGSQEAAPGPSICRLFAACLTSSLSCTGYMLPFRWPRYIYYFKSIYAPPITTYMLRVYFLFTIYSRKMCLTYVSWCFPHTIDTLHTTHTLPYRT